MNGFMGKHGGGAPRVEIDNPKASLNSSFATYQTFPTIFKSWQLSIVIGTTNSHPVCVLDALKIIEDCRGE